ncbi:hypothetical protein JVT61DRAFT_9145 [Boletus reticuloceps]|uniref:THIF-type NAD/FAD binding fold domain-containing protein n=1 Tax=Boletus reticuloceps TaxID=495285 RepID=A0A8I2YH67_9AGAM|nr:hypothetical protein JVT61DRAFT_9145 [Boletus reticuloceps]
MPLLNSTRPTPPSSSLRARILSTGDESEEALLFTDIGDRARTQGASAMVVPRLVSLLAYTPSTLKHGWTAQSGRYAHAEAILGSEFVGRLADTRVLLVGCELLKNIVLTGFGHITLLDLNTIDLSNLNRQFLFKKKDVLQPCSVSSVLQVAAQTAGAFHPNVRIQPIHANIKESQFDVEWFQSSDIILNALDNFDARRHVNKMCMAAGIPLVESGTAGYLGQVQPLLKDRTECFDCISKPASKSFPVCTIRSTPSQPIHCIVWAKSYLLPQSFGEDEDGSTELDEAVRNALRSQQTTDDAAKTVFEKVRFVSGDATNVTKFMACIRSSMRILKYLLSVADMWRSREKPPHDDAILDDSFVVKEPTKIAASSSNSKGQVNRHTNGGAMKPSSSNGNGGLKDQRALTLRDNLALSCQGMLSSHCKV